MIDRRVAERFGHNLFHCRHRAELSQEALAERADLHREEIGLFESGKRLPRLDTLLKLTAGADATPRELLAGMRWNPGRYRYVGGDFYVEGDSGWAG